MGLSHLAEHCAQSQTYYISAYFLNENKPKSEKKKCSIINWKSNRWAQFWAFSFTAINHPPHPIFNLKLTRPQMIEHQKLGKSLVCVKILINNNNNRYIESFSCKPLSFEPMPSVTNIYNLKAHVYMYIIRVPC